MPSRKRAEKSISGNQAAETYRPSIAISEETSLVEKLSQNDTQPAMGSEKKLSDSAKANSSKVKSSKQGKSKTLWQTINSEIVWYSIAISCVLAVFLFYFQGLQPRILDSYVNQSKNRVLEVNKTFSQQVSSVNKIQQQFLQGFEYDSSQLCSADAAYKNKSTDLSDLERVKVGLIPKPEFKSLPTFSGFYLNEVESVYQEYYKSYSQSLESVSQKLDVWSGIPNYLDYRNTWITACDQIRTSAGSLNTLRAVCTDLTTKTDSYKSKSLPKFWSEIETTYSGTLDLCQDVIKAPSRATTLSQFGTWQLEWMSRYGRIISYIPNQPGDLDEINQAIDKLRLASEQAGTQLNDSYNSRIGFSHIWYIMQYRS